jgi:hypothetical protein
MIAGDYAFAEWSHFCRQHSYRITLCISLILGCEQVSATHISLAYFA